MDRDMESEGRGLVVWEVDDLVEGLDARWSGRDVPDT